MANQSLFINSQAPNFYELLGSTLELTGDGGKVVVGYMEDNKLNAMKKLPADLRKKIIAVKVRDSGYWVRDQAASWRQHPDGKFQLSGIIDGDGTFNGNDGLGLVMSLLSACSDGEIMKPISKPEESLHLQGGNFVRNGGTCLIPEDSLAPAANITKYRKLIKEIKFDKNGRRIINPSTQNAIEALKDRAKEKLLSDYGCEQIIPLPSLPTTYKGKDLHPNGHIDIGVSLLTEKVAVVPMVDKKCKGEINKLYTEKFDKIAWELIGKGILALRYPVALGCIYKEKDYPPVIHKADFFKDFPNGFDHDDYFAEKGIPQAVVRSYSNTLIMNDGYGIPEFLPPRIEEKCSLEGENRIYKCKSNQVCVNTRKKACIKIGPKKDFVKRLQEENDKFKRFLQKLMENGTIPQKKIVQIPVSNSMVYEGGAARCLTFQIPHPINSCEQETLERKLLDHIKALESASCELSASGGTDSVCKLARDSLNAAKRLSSNKLFGSKIHLLDKENDKPIEIKNDIIFKIIDKADKLLEDFKLFCKKLKKKKSWDIF